MVAFSRPSPVPRSTAPGARGVRRVRALALALATLAAIPACRSTRTDQTAGAKPEAAAATTVRVENRSFLDQNVYVLRGGQRVRLGTVNGNSTQVFTIPRNLVFGVSSLSFLVDPIGGSRTPVSNEVPVSEGDQVRLIIPP